MNIYFDKDNFIDFIYHAVIDESTQFKKSIKISKDWHSINELLCKQCNIFVDFDLPTDTSSCTDWFEKFLENTEISDVKLFRKLYDAWVDESQPRLKCEYGDFEKFLNSSDDKFKQYTSVFLRRDIYEDDRFHGFLKSNKHTQFTLGQLLVKDRSIPASVKDIAHNNWDKLIESPTPCTDIIISDPYIFQEDPKSSRQNNYALNVYALLERLNSCNDTNYPVNIVFITIDKPYKDNNTGRRVHPRWEDIKQSIQQDTCINARVTFIKPKKEILEEEGRDKVGQHDRTIFTNYKMYISGDSFTYFDYSDNNQSQGLWFTELSMADRENEKVASSFIQRCQNIINACKTRSTEDFKSEIYGDMSSNFLDF